MEKSYKPATTDIVIDCLLHLISNIKRARIYICSNRMQIYKAIKKRGNPESSTNGKHHSVKMCQYLQDLMDLIDESKLIIE